MTTAWRAEPLADHEEPRAALWRRLVQQTVPVPRPVADLAREALGLFSGPSSPLVKDLRSLAARDRNWRPSRGQTSLILSIVSRNGLRRLDGEPPRAAEGLENTWRRWS